MKKLLIVITLFTSSFFLFKNDVKAYEYNVSLDFSIINEDFYNLKNQMEEFIKTDEVFSDYYIIRYYDNAYSVSLFSSNFNNVFKIYKNDGTELTYYNEASGTCYFTNGTLSCPTSANSARLTLYKSSEIQPFRYIIYSNFDLPMLSNIVFNYTYEDFTYSDSIDTTNKFTNLTDIYVEYQKFSGTYVEPTDPHEEEIKKIDNFYNVIFDRLSFLAEEMVSNYVFLSMIVISILVLVFVTVFRRYL